MVRECSNCGYENDEIFMEGIFVGRGTVWLCRKCYELGKQKAESYTTQKSQITNNIMRKKYGKVKK